MSHPESWAERHVKEPLLEHSRTLTYIHYRNITYLIYLPACALFESLPLWLHSTTNCQHGRSIESMIIPRSDIPRTWGPTTAATDHKDMGEWGLCSLPMAVADKDCLTDLCTTSDIARHSGRRVASVTAGRASNLNGVTQRSKVIETFNCRKV